LDAAAASPAKIEGASATYAEVRADADLELYPTADGLKEIIVLRSVDAPTSWTFPLSLDGLTASMDKAGQVELVDRSGEVRAIIPHGWMEDAGTTGPAGGPSSSTGVTYTLGEAADGQVLLQVELDREWLAAPERVFPVRVDPTVTYLNGGADDTYVSSANPFTSHSADWALNSGIYVPTSDVNHIYIHFNNSPAMVNANILNADVNLYNWLSAQCTNHPVSLYEVTQGWAGATMPWPGATIGGEVAQSSFGFSNTVACPGGWGQFNDTRLTDLVEDWHSAVKPNNGISVRTSSSNGNHYKEFYSASCVCDPPNFNFRPQMNVTWTPYDATSS
nr:DNRLRE domain-containing protein [Micromonospora sp. DSM 115978]